MAVFAHPDDVDFGCSGTLASWIKTAGTHVTYCVITSGQKGTHDPKVTRSRWRDTAARAARRRRGDRRERVRVPRHQDGELERTMELRAEVCLAIREDKPDVVFTNDPWAHFQIHPIIASPGGAGSTA